MRLAESIRPARLALSLLTAAALITGASRALADSPSGPQGVAPGSQGSKQSGPNGKNCLCYGTKHDGPLKDLCVIKCRCPGECGKEGARRPGSSDSK